mmetsp:Transcript_16348/g.41705  ORF Transcript_16348/g.41705 Transcript_16348/m.41705 type:complete len:300 (+) Transcript_16348:498-1397(+)
MLAGMIQLDTCRPSAVSMTMAATSRTISSLALSTRLATRFGIRDCAWSCASVPVTSRFTPHNTQRITPTSIMRGMRVAPFLMICLPSTTKPAKNGSRLSTELKLAPSAATIAGSPAMDSWGSVAATNVVSMGRRNDHDTPAPIMRTRAKYGRFQMKRHLSHPLMGSSLQKSRSFSVGSLPVFGSRGSSPPVREYPLGGSGPVTLRMFRTALLRHPAAVFPMRPVRLSAAFATAPPVDDDIPVMVVWNTLPTDVCSSSILSMAAKSASICIDAGSGVEVFLLDDAVRRLFVSGRFSSLSS